MSDILSGLVESSNFPLLTALLLGLMTAISPCPLATNITAIGFIGRELESRKRVFISGIIYTLGRSFSYTLLALLIVKGVDQFSISGFFQRYGEKIVGPLLVVIGLLMLDIFRLRLPFFARLFEGREESFKGGYLSVFALGVIYALAFCPYSGVLYFGLLIPLTISSSEGLLLPVVFAIATGIPVILFSWLLAFAVSGVGRLYNGIKAFETWFRRIIAILFIATGIYYIIVVLL
ncbi:MAG: aromatic aminobenezylarsenical efflux permease ArsG family transporter [Bacteroidales bacterium]